MHRRALGDLVDDLLFGADGYADDLGIVGCVFGKDGSVGGVVAGCKHLLDEERRGDAALQRTAVDCRHRFVLCRQYNNRLDGKRIVEIAHPVFVGLTDHLGVLSGNAAHQESRDVQLLPGCKIVSQDDRNFGIKHSSHFHAGSKVALDQDVTSHAFEGLERLCTEPGADGIVIAPAFPGIERMEAQFSGKAFEPHRHDTYALGVTMKGVQTFSYRGQRRFSMPGQVLVLHPDEEHDGGAGTDDGLQYRMLYLEPALLLECLGVEKIGLPFVDDPVIGDPVLAGTLLAALSELDRELDELFVDDFVSRVAGGLAKHAKTPQRPLGNVAWQRARLARDYLEAHATEAVRSGELETVTGLDRFSLSRHFRAAFATSPHRYLLMRRLQQARAMIGAGDGLSDVAAATGFADQSHLTRHFKKAYGMTPGQWASLRRASPQGRIGVR